MDEEDYSFHDDGAASPPVRDLIALADAYERVTDRKMRERLLAGADAVLACMSIQVHPTHMTTQ